MELCLELFSIVTYFGYFQSSLSWRDSKISCFSWNIRFRAETVRGFIMFKISSSSSTACTLVRFARCSPGTGPFRIAGAEFSPIYFFVSPFFFFFLPFFTSNFWDYGSSIYGKISLFFFGKSSSSVLITIPFGI